MKIRQIGKLQIGKFPFWQIAGLPDIILPEVFRRIFYKTEKLKTVPFRIFPLFSLEISEKFVYFSK